jgi:ABC-type multidrug transport system fused ATPase/permease subunit
MTFIKDPHLQRVFKLIREPKKLYWGMIAVLISTTIGTTVPFIYGRLVDLAIKTPYAETITIVRLIIFWLVLSVIGDTLARYSGRQAYEMGIDLNDDLLVDLFHHLIDLPLGFHKTQKMGKVLKRVDRSLTDLLGLIDRTLFAFLPAVLSFLISIAALILVSWKLSLVIVVASIIYVVITINYTKDIIKKQRSMHRGWEKADGSLWDAVLNVQAVKAAVAEKFEKRRNQGNYDQAGRTFKSWRYIWLQMEWFQKLLFSLSFITIFSGGVVLLRSGQMSPGKLIMFFGYMNLLTVPLSQLGQQYRSIKSGLFSLRRSLKYYDLTPEHDIKDAVPIENLRGEVEFDHVDFGYNRSNIVLHNVSFKASAGETVAFVGESGVGKSTLVDMIGRYYTALSGRVLIDGVDIHKIQLKSLREQMAIVPQEVLLFNDSIKNNIRYGKPNATDEEVKKAAEAANAAEFIEAFPHKYSQLVGERGIKLSVGQKQRLAIARAILRDPKILILDEATSALDSRSEKMVQQAINEVIKGRTTFIIAHRLSTIQKADKIIVLEKGKIAEIGTHEELMKNPDGIYRNFWELQTAIGKVI